MRLNRIVALAAFGVLLLVVNVGMAAAQEGKAGAEIKDVEDKTIGKAQLTETSGETRVAVQAEGIDPGEHGIHFHETGECEPADSKAFDSAGKHFNPGQAEHGLENQEGPHAGDLPNLTVDEDGTTVYEETTPRVSLAEGEGNLFDTDDSALIIHAKVDDQETDPTGDSGDRVACGVIKTSAVAQQGSPSSGGAGLLPVLLIAAIAFVVVIGIFLYRRA